MVWLVWVVVGGGGVGVVWSGVVVVLEWHCNVKLSTIQLSGL